METKILQTVKYKNCSVSEKGIVSLTLEAPPGEAENSIRLVALLGKTVEVRAKPEDRKAFRLGFFLLKSLAFDKDMNAQVKLSALSDTAETKELSGLAGKDFFRVNYLYESEEE